MKSGEGQAGLTILFFKTFNLETRLSASIPPVQATRIFFPDGASLYTSIPCLVRCG